ncbi:ATP-binding cassette domain-containing protein [Floricoccus penangensis]|uniref:ABC transporter ATP-binding protein/permease n=1 Tax=Floricoccus penangensis TaxID=1859475 RepID=UPI002041FA1B|nr:ABC transporter ATP-binding protein/permease [Floricoccus penangensis]URZ87684.1 ATP-binding cassette domain-containing protein [Floricoccus penangensis]
MPILELKNIRKSYYLGKEEFPVLKGLNLSFERGEFASILGESGGGKSTLMNIIGGLDKEFEGEVIVNNEDQRSKTEKAMDDYRRSTVGFIFQSFNLVNYLSVLDNVLLSLKMTNLNHSQQVKKAEELLKQVGLFEHRKKNPNQLSGGQKQRVAIARALANDPEIIIADEPTGALDSQNTKEVLKILSDIAESGKTVIVVTHSQEVADCGTRIIRLADGQITSDEKLRDPYTAVQAKPAFKNKAMSFSSSLGMAWKHFLYNWKQNLLIALGTGIGLFSVMVFLGLGNGVSQFANKQVSDQLNPNYPMIMRRVTKDDKTPNELAMQESQQSLYSGDENSLFDDQLIDKIKKVDHVKSVTESYNINPVAPGKLTVGNFSENFQTITSWGSNQQVSAIKAGKVPKAGEILISKQAALKYDNENFKSIVGKNVKLSYTIMSSDAKKAINIEKEYTVSGVADVMTQSGTIFMDQSELKQTLKDNGAQTKTGIVIAEIDDSKNVDQALKDIQNIKNNGKKAFVTAGSGDILKTINSYLDIIKYVLAAIAGISLIVSIFMIVVTTYMSVTERTKEIGILRAMGSRKKDIRRLFTGESLMLGIFAAIIAIAGALAGQTLLNKALYSLAKFNLVQITSGAVIFAIVVGIVIALVASIAPSSRASKMNMIEALASE